MMRRSDGKRVVTVARVAAMAAVMSGCGFFGEDANPQAAELAAQSCTSDAASLSPTSAIVAFGLEWDPVTVLDGDPAVVASARDLVRRRALLAAQAAAIDPMWQPLADAWTAIEGSIWTQQGRERFIEDVNLGYASVIKDSYCRIAFVAMGAETTYAPSSDATSTTLPSAQPAETTSTSTTAP
jgi:hypothetical protein